MKQNWDYNDSGLVCPNCGQTVLSCQCSSVATFRELNRLARIRDFYKLLFTSPELDQFPELTHDDLWLDWECHLRQFDTARDAFSVNIN